MAFDPGPQPTVIKDAENLPAIIQGRTPDSTEEARVARALDNLKVDYYYQYPFNGGSMVAGGQVIDFVAYVPPKPVPIYVNGEYWHSGQKGIDDAIKQQEVANTGRFAQPVVLWGNDLTSVDSAQALLERALA